MLTNFVERPRCFRRPTMRVIYRTRVRTHVPVLLCIRTSRTVVNNFQRRLTFNAGFARVYSPIFAGIVLTHYRVASTVWRTIRALGRHVRCTAILARIYHAKATSFLSLMHFVPRYACTRDFENRNRIFAIPISLLPLRRNDKYRGRKFSQREEGSSVE